MYQIILKNLDKIFISLSGFLLIELFQKYYNLKTLKIYKNYCIKTKEIYHIDMYKKNNLINLKNLNFINFPYLQHIKSLSIIIKDNNTHEIFNNVKYIKPQNFLYYKNDFIIENIIKALKEQDNTQEFINLTKLNKLNKNIKYKTSWNQNAICLYKDNKLILITDDNNNIFVKSMEDEIKYFAFLIIFAVFGIIYK